MEEPLLVDVRYSGFVLPLESGKLPIARTPVGYRFRRVFSNQAPERAFRRAALTSSKSDLTAGGVVVKVSGDPGKSRITVRTFRRN